ncbi:MAG: DUF2254 family protein [Thermovirgaceae bacterium]
MRSTLAVLIGALVTALSIAFSSTVVVLDGTDFEGYADTAFNQIRQYGGKDPSILIHLLESFEKIYGHTCKRSH